MQGGMDMKNIIIALLIVLNVNNVVAKSNDYDFMIYGDSKNLVDVYEVKKDLLKEYKMLIEGLDEIYIEEAIQECLNNESVSFENRTLIVLIGDGKGKKIGGKLKANYCEIEKEDLETEFFFKKLWQKATS